MSAAAPSLHPGEVLLAGARRSFSVRADTGRTLKGLFFGRSAPGPAPVHALDDVSLRVAPGETLGIVGRNGAGKSSTLRVLAGIVPLEAGFAGCGGRAVSLLDLGTGFSRDFSGRENIYLQGALYGFDRAGIEARLAEIVEFSELGRFIDVPVKTYSAGMFVRLGFAIAAHLDADVLLIDEVLAVGDEGFQRKCLARISAQIAAGTTLVFVSHDLGAVERVCRRLVVLDGGQVSFDGPVAEGLSFYRREMGTEGPAGVDPPSSGAKVLAVSVHDEQGNPASVFAPGDVLRVRVELRGQDQPDPPGRVRISFRTRGGETLARAEEAVDPGGGERLRFEYRIERLPLLGGDFTVSAGLSAATAASADRLGPEYTAAFSVAEVAGAAGPVDLRGAWTASRALRVQP